MEMIETQRNKDNEGSTVKAVHCKVEAETECLSCLSETLGKLCMSQLRSQEDLAILHKEGSQWRLLRWEDTSLVFAGRASLCTKDRTRNQDLDTERQPIKASR